MHMAHTVTTLVLLSFTTIYCQGSSTNVDRYIFCKQWFPRKWDLLIILRPWDSLVSVKVSLNAYWLLTWSWCIKRMIIRSLCVQAGDLLKRHVCCYFTSAVILRLLLFYICCYFASAVILRLLLFDVCCYLMSAVILRLLLFYVCCYLMSAVIHVIFGVVQDISNKDLQIYSEIDLVAKVYYTANGEITWPC